MLSVIHSTTVFPFGSVTTYDECICIRFGFIKNLVLPLPEPPITRTFLFLAIFEFFGLLFIVSRSVCVSSTLFSNTGSINGAISSCVPQRAEPYSSFLRNFFAFLPFTYTLIRKITASAIPINRSVGLKLGKKDEKALP